jgi:hypothetical protein
MIDDLAEQATSSSLLLLTRYPVYHPDDRRFGSWKKRSKTTFTSFYANSGCAQLYIWKTPEVKSGKVEEF